MAEMIAGLYEINEQIGAGGGGIVYLGRHVRLDKQVVLKADKRTLRAGTETLRREVDMLKGLSHTYIPQVYDFVQEDGVVYTVMDYIAGESFDKILARQQYLAQKDLIKWSCQLLDALIYLHGQGEYGILHGDIKPANIMLRANGDICLIDFNIALALGEDGAVKVGFSRGYASPEHYGAEYVSGGRESVVQVSFSNQESERTTVESERTLVDDGEQTEVDTQSAKMLQNVPRNASKQMLSINKKKAILLDVRSDIYSLGATLYHMYSGRRPAQRAEEVEPLTQNDCSEQICKIIQKAMAPNPADRYQTANEMLEAFLALRKKDARVVRRRRRLRVCFTVGASAFAIGGFLTFVGMKQMEQHQGALTLASYSEKELKEGNRKKAVELALSSLPREGNIFDADVTAESQLALSNALGVYQLSDEYVDDSRMELEGAPFEVIPSPEGNRYAVVCAYRVSVYDCGEEQPIVQLQTQESALSDCVFVDNNLIVYAGNEGVTAFNLDTKEQIWIGDVATNLALSGNGRKLAAVNRDATEVQIYDVISGNKTAVCDLDGQHMSVAENDRFADPKDYLFEMNEDGSRLAISFSNGGVWLVDTSAGGDDIILYDESDHICFDGGFSGNLFVYSAEEKNGHSQMGFVDMNNLELIACMESDDPYLIQTIGQMIYIANGHILEVMDSRTLKEKELAYVEDARITQFAIGEKYNLIARDDGKFAYYDKGANLFSERENEYGMEHLAIVGEYAYIANRSDPYIWIQHLENHSDATILTYDVSDHHDEARVSHDRKKTMLFRYDHFSIYDENGLLIRSVDIPDAGQVYDQQFIREKEKSYLEVIWYDGTVRRYSALDGSMQSEEQEDAPDRSLLEEFWTDNYHIVSTLHDAPQVYDKKTDQVVKTLDGEDYLTYVTQTNEGIVFEYVTAEGQRYGYLLDESLNQKAYMPNLCDVVDDTFIFDDGSGELRSTDIYTLDELIDTAKDVS